MDKAAGGCFSWPYSASEICIKKAQFYQARGDDADILIFATWAFVCCTPIPRL
jgi:hypothetical protein